MSKKTPQQVLTESGQMTTPDIRTGADKKKKAKGKK